MGYQIVCPRCKKTISKNSIIDDAAKGKGSPTRSIVCECGERITYQQVTAQLDQTYTPGRRILDWARGLVRRRG